MRISRLKTTYQRNMIIGQGVALSISAIIFVSLGLSTSPKIAVEQFEFDDQKISIKWSGQPETEQIGTDGVFGLVGQSRAVEPERTYPYWQRPTIIDDQLSLSNSETQKTKTELFALLLETAIASRVSDSFGSPSYDDNEFIGAAAFGWLDYPWNKPPKLLTSPARLIHRAKLEYPTFAEEAGQEGEVEFLVLIDQAGQPVRFLHEQTGQEPKLIDHLLLREEPESWFFARKAWESIQGCQFSPRIENGRAVSSMVRLTCFFCLSYECHARKVIEMEQTASISRP